VGPRVDLWLGAVEAGHLFVEQLRVVAEVECPAAGRVDG
jgi:hypothetical protein